MIRVHIARRPRFDHPQWAPSRIFSPEMLRIMRLRDYLEGAMHEYWLALYGVPNAQDEIRAPAASLPPASAAVQ